MAYIEIVEKPQDPKNMNAADLPDGKFKFLNTDKFENVHDVTWHSEDILLVLNQEDVMGTTLIPMKYTEIEYVDGVEKVRTPSTGEENPTFGQGVVGVTEIEIEGDFIGQPMKNAISIKIGDIIALSCSPSRDTKGGKIKKFYLEKR